jgi:murein DD-endopeptidase MepM/ murein hydrolase activator NlpD
LRRRFPDREFFMRSEGHVRFIRVSGRLQMGVAFVVSLAVLCWLVTFIVVAVNRITATYDRQSLLNREARVENAENRVKAYRKGLNTVADDLKRRQDFIEKMVNAHVGALPRDKRKGETVSDSDKEAQRTVAKVSAAVPEAAGLARIEERQLAFVEQLTRYADRRADADSAQMRRLGLAPEMMLGRLNSGVGEGGPLLRLATAANGSIDPRFERLGVSLARMEALEDGMTRLPQVLPAKSDYMSSGFGYRRDPFTRSGSFHPGLDFRASSGAPIYAAARGTVTFAGQRSGYGNCVEVTHSPGLVTRYAHMSSIRSRVGQQVDAGQVIGLVGSTGRSTGPHLHFEVRVNDHPINPRPFLEARSNVSEKSGTDGTPAADD